MNILSAERVGNSLPGRRDEGLGGHDKEEHDEGAEQVGVEHFISHLGKLKSFTKKELHVKHH